ncbi:hypothetical protein CCR75_004211 [Bremia lactucae]|uniref:Transmembrane protein n=1 Tax=Bremia lactucae TaxID=4779 RepID=A0A976FKM7_BRELC|nr:hypothetical protein CCR75_004211 [Bremia lactucae]
MRTTSFSLSTAMRPWHSRHTFLVPLLLLCVFITAQDIPLPKPPRPPISLASRVTGEANNIVISRGVGRRRSEAHSIAANTGITTNVANVLKFTPTYVNLGRAETCVPQRYDVYVENTGSLPVRLERVECTHDAFYLLTDLNGLELAPKGRLRVEFMWLPRQEDTHGVEAHLKVLTSSGWFNAVPLRSMKIVQNRYKVSAIHASIPVGVLYQEVVAFTNPMDATIRITQVDTFDTVLEATVPSASPFIRLRRLHEEAMHAKSNDERHAYDTRPNTGWEMLPHVPSPLVHVVLDAETRAGVYTTWIHVLAGITRLLVIPVHLTVLDPGLYPIPAIMDFGILLNLDDDAYRKITIDLINTNVYAVEVLDVVLAENNLIQSTQFEGYSVVVPPQTRINHALVFQIQLDQDMTGRGAASLVLTTNASNIDDKKPVLKVYGHVVHGYVGYWHHETQWMDEVPMARELNPMEDRLRNTDVIMETLKWHTLQLWNYFDGFVELQRVYIDTLTPELDAIQVDTYTQETVSTNSSWSDILFQIRPSFVPSNESIAHTYTLVVETNVSTHEIELTLHYGLLRAKSTRGLAPFQSWMVDFVHVDLTRLQLKEKSLRSCRSLVFECETIVSNRSLTEVVTLMNDNPVPLSLTISQVHTSDVVFVSLTATIVQISFEDLHTTQDTSTHFKTVVAGQRFDLLPGYQVNLSITINSKDSKVGHVIVPVTTIETVMEELYFFASFTTVLGTVEPVTSQLIVPSMFPGRTLNLHVLYRNTFDHAVLPFELSMSNRDWKVVSIHETHTPDAMISVELAFSPAWHTRCVNAVFLADCMLPVSEAGQNDAELSEYGEFVTSSDLDAITHRDLVWRQFHASKNPYVLETIVQLHTKSVQDVANVTILTHVERPSILASTFRTTGLRFELTDLLERRQLYIPVRNPSNMTVHMELAISQTEQRLFFACEHETNDLFRLKTNELDELFGSMDGIALLCLLKWKELNSDAVTFQWFTHDDRHVAPFYFRKRMVQVEPGEEAQLGPIYYYPSRVQALTTSMYVRNTLSHLETVPLFAQSEKGTLRLEIDTIGGGQKPRFIPKERLGDAQNEGIPDDATLYENQGLWRFGLRLLDVSTNYTQSGDMRLTNIGPFNLTIHSVSVGDLDDFSWLLPSVASTVKPQKREFQVALDDVSIEKNDKGHVVLPFESSVRYRVTFRATCYVSKVSSWLIVMTSDGIKLVLLQGTITMHAAFECQRSRVAKALQNMLYWTWLLAVTVSGLAIVHAMFLLAHDVVMIRKTYQTRLSIDRTRSETTNAKVLDNTGTSITLRLDAMELAAFTPNPRVEMRAVSQLIEQRSKDGSTRRKNGIRQEHQDGMGTKKPLLRDVKAHVPPMETSNRVCATKLTGLNDSKHSVSSYNESLIQTIVESSLERVDSQEPRNSSSKTRTRLESSTTGLNSSRSNRVLWNTTDQTTLLPQVSCQTKGFMRKRGRTREDKKVVPSKPLNQAEEAFEAFKSVSTRWRSEDWQRNLSNEACGGSDWSEWLSFHNPNTVVTDIEVTRETKDCSFACRDDATKAYGVKSQLPIDPFAASAPVATSTTSSTMDRKAPPGFTAADAQPLETRAAFEHFRHNSGFTTASPLASTSRSFGNYSVFTSSLPLSGPALPSTRDENMTLGNVGRIGSGRSKVFRGLGSPTMK